LQVAVRRAIDEAVTRGRADAVVPSTFALAVLTIAFDLVVVVAGRRPDDHQRKETQDERASCQCSRSTVASFGVHHFLAFLLLAAAFRFSFRLLAQEFFHLFL
jgi:hypothetical protein